MTTSVLKIYILLLTIFSSLFIGCGSTALYIEQFDSAKDKIDTFVLFKPYVVVEDIQTGVKMPDYRLRAALEESILAKTQSMLKGKYVMVYDSLSMQDWNLIKLDTILNQLKNTERLTVISFNNVFKNTNLQFAQYSLLITYHGSFHGKYPPNYNLHRGIFTGTIQINAPNETTSYMQILVIDNTTYNIVYYDAVESSQDDPRSIDKMEKTTAKLLKYLYYK